MRITHWVIAAALGASLLVTGCNKTTNPPSGNGAVLIVLGASSLGAQAYSPSTLRVTAGTEITWTNNDTVTHTVTRAGTSAENFDSGNINPGGTFRHTFNDVGTFAYACTLHPSMSGVVVVQ